MGIHGRHLDDRSRIRYISTDDRRQVIPVVYYTDDKGKTVEYVSTDIKVTQGTTGEGRNTGPWIASTATIGRRTRLNCQRMPWIYRMSRGVISPELPFIRKKAVELLKADYPDRDTAKKRDRRRNYELLPDQLSGYLQHQARPGGTVGG